MTLSDETIGRIAVAVNDDEHLSHFQDIMMQNVQALSDQISNLQPPDKEVGMPALSRIYGVLVLNRLLTSFQVEPPRKRPCSEQRIDNLVSGAEGEETKNHNPTPPTTLDDTENRPKAVPRTRRSGSTSEKVTNTKAAPNRPSGAIDIQVFIVSYQTDGSEEVLLIKDLEEKTELTGASVDILRRAHADPKIVNNSINANVIKLTKRLHTQEVARQRESWRDKKGPCDRCKTSASRLQCIPISTTFNN